MKKVSVVIVACLLVQAASGFADTVYLKNGRTYEGEIVSDTKYSVKIMIKGLPKVFYTDEIDRVEYTKKVSEIQQVVEEERALNEGPVSDAKRELILRLLAANGALDGVRQSLRVLLGSVPPEQRKKFEKHLSAQKLADQFVPIYAKYYTEGELKEMIRFYSSEAGKRTLEVTPNVMEESLAAAVEYFKSLDEKEKN